MYSYFKDKRQIYIAAFENYLSNISEHLFERLDVEQSFQLSDFVERWITNYVLAGEIPENVLKPVMPHVENHEYILNP